MGDAVKKEIAPELKAIQVSEIKFTPSCGLEFSKEQSFAIQQIQKNDFSLNIARSNSKSLLDAMANVANIGLSLNPATKLAYLVPRDKAIHLDISYMGLIKLATDSGVIEWVQAEMVYSNDTFLFNGLGEKPTHHCDPFADDRGYIKGVYCVAKTTNGDYLACAMSLKEVLEVKATSKNSSSQYSPWNTFFNEMAKKTVIKRASKLWPKSKGLERLDNAIQVINEHEGLSQNNDLMTDSQHREIAQYTSLYGKKEDEVAKIADVNRYQDLTFSDGKKILAFIEKLKPLQASINGIKNSIKCDDAFSVYEILEELSDEESALILNQAPTKGGCLSVDERNFINSEDFRKAANQELDRIADEELDKQQLAVNQ